MKNYTRIIPAFLILGATLFSSCDDETDDIIETIDCVITELTFSREADSGNENTFNDKSDVTITYDENDRITSVRERYEVEFCTGTNCEQDNDLFETRINYSADGNASVQFFQNNILTEEIFAELILDGEKFETYRLTELFEEEVDYIDEYRFFYQADKISKIELWSVESSNESLSLRETMSFTYTGNNVTNYRILNSDDVLTFEINATYDDKVNPFLNRLPIFFSELNFDTIYEIPFLLSENNPVSIQTENFEDIEEFGGNINYEYNEFGVPQAYKVMLTGRDGFDFDAAIINECN